MALTESRRTVFRGGVGEFKTISKSEMTKFFVLFFIFTSAFIGTYSHSQNTLDDNIKVTPRENNGKCVIYIKGDITSKLQPELEKAMESFSTAVCIEKIINLDSRGGAGFAAEGVGRLIRANSYNTHVSLGSQCSSACGFIFIGGVERTIEVSRYSTRHSDYKSPPKFGFHSPRISGTDPNDLKTCITAQENSNLVDPKFEKTQIRVYNYAIQMLGRESGIMFAQSVFQIKCADMIYASPEGLINTKIATSILKTI